MNSSHAVSISYNASIQNGCEIVYESPLDAPAISYNKLLEKVQPFKFTCTLYG